MPDEPASLEATRLLSKYKKVSARGYYEDSYEVRELGALCRVLRDKSPPPRGSVASELLAFFDQIYEDFDEINHGTISWPVLDACILQAVHYVAQGENEADSARIAVEIAECRRAWCGQT